MGNDLTELGSVIGDFQRGDGLWESLIIVVTLLIGWGMHRLIMSWLQRFEETHSFPISMIGKLSFPFLFVVSLALVGQVITQGALSPLLPKYSLRVNVINLASSATVVWLILRLFFILMFVAFRQADWVRLVMRVVNIIAWGGFLIEVTGWFSTLVNRIGDIGFTYGRQDITIGIVTNGILVIGLTLLFTLAVSALIERTLLHSKTIAPNLQVLFGRLTKAALLTAGVLFALVSIGFPLSSVSVFGGALGVGLGFGLQKVMSNYISGFIILLDRSIKIGDLVTISDCYGQITQITTRYMVLRAPDATEALVPNETVLTSMVTNHSYSDRRTQLVTEVGVDYDADVRLAMQLMIEAAKIEPRVLGDPQPSVFLKAFGDSALQLQMTFWINDPESGRLGLVSRVNLTILESFRERGINIPFPTRSVQIASADQSKGGDGGSGKDQLSG